MAGEAIEFECNLGFHLSSDYRRSVCRQQTEDSLIQDSRSKIQDPRSRNQAPRNQAPV